MRPGLILFWTITLLVSAIGLAAEEVPSLLDKRKGHTTKLIKNSKGEGKLVTPPEGSGFKLVSYPAQLGKLPAYLSAPDEKKGKGPAIIWLTGGFPVSSPSSYLWEETTIENEQSARIYRIKGITMLFPTLRGGKADNPGFQEIFYGEVNDVLSARDYLAGLDHIDPKRIYLGGHSTGGTLALLTAAASDKFAGVFSLGPAHDGYGKEVATYAWTSKERELREPIRHLDSIKVPTYVLEGEDGRDLGPLLKSNKNKLITILEIKGTDHFEVIHPLNTIFAQAIIDSKSGQLEIDPRQLLSCVDKQRQDSRESSDLQELADYRGGGLNFDTPRKVTFFLLGRSEAALKKAATDDLLAGFKAGTISSHKNSEGEPYHVLKLEKTIDLNSLKLLFNATAAVSSVARKHDLHYDDWTAE